MPWDAEPRERQPTKVSPSGRKRRVSGRGPLGSPTDAEQLMIEAAIANDAYVSAIAPSIPACGDCVLALKDEGIMLVNPLAASESPDSQHVTAQEALRQVNELRIQIKNQVDLYQGELKTQKDLIEKPSFAGFWGYWTNELFSTQPPPLSIWDGAEWLLIRAKTQLDKGDPEAALNATLHARRAHLIALDTYSKWLGNLPGAAAKMERAIKVAAVAAVVAFVAPTVVARLAPSAAGAAQTEQVTIRVAESIARADRVFLATDATSAAAELAEAERMAAMAEEMQVLRALRPF
jgi:hypothetical protein